MNAAWRGISEEKEITIFVDSSHKTAKNFMKTGAFTVSMATADYVTECDYVGVVSANDVPDKVAKAGFHVIKSEFVNAPLFEELPMTLECKAMNIERINSYNDNRFSQRVLHQHGCFLADREPYEVEIISEHEAVVRGKDPSVYPAIIERFLFFTPHITTFYDEKQTIIREYPRVKLLELPLDEIQPSQFYVDKDKIDAIRTFIEKGEEIIIQVSKYKDRYISLDGHTRLYYAAMKGFETVRAVLAETDDCMLDFVKEAQKRGIFTPKDLKLVPHKEYEEKWNKYCDDYFSAQ